MRIQKNTSEMYVDKVFSSDMKNESNNNEDNNTEGNDISSIYNSYDQNSSNTYYENKPNNENYNTRYSNEDDVVYAGFFARLAAFLIDIIIVGLVLMTLKVPMWIISIFNPEFILLRPVLFDFSTWDIIIYLLSSFYFILLTYFKGATIGKFLLRLRVVSDKTEDGKLSLINAIYRETIGRYLSSLFFIGYLFIGATSDKRALHDILCDTHVVYN